MSKPMPTRIEVNCETGEVIETELTGEELAAYEAAVAAQNELES